MMDTPAPKQQPVEKDHTKLGERGIDSLTESPAPSAYTLDDFLPLLLRLLMPQPPLTTAPDFTPKSFLDSIQIYDDGTDEWLCVYVNGAWQMIMFDGVTSLVAGDGISLDPADGRGVVTITSSPSYSPKLETRGGSDASGSEAIAHGLGKVPTVVRITAKWASGTPQLLQSLGTYSAAGMKNINTYTMVGTGGGTGNDTTNIVVISDRGGNAQFAAVTSMDATNINLDWTKAGALGGTIELLVEAFG